MTMTTSVYSPVPVTRVLKESEVNNILDYCFNQYCEEFAHNHAELIRREDVLFNVSVSSNTRGSTITITICLHGDNSTSKEFFVPFMASIDALNTVRRYSEAVGFKLTTSVSKSAHHKFIESDWHTWHTL